MMNQLKQATRLAFNHLMLSPQFAGRNVAVVCENKDAARRVIDLATVQLMSRFEVPPTEIITDIDEVELGIRRGNSLQKHAREFNADVPDRFVYASPLRPFGSWATLFDSHTDYKNIPSDQLENMHSPKAYIRSDSMLTEDTVQRFNLELACLRLDLLITEQAVKDELSARVVMQKALTVLETRGWTQGLLVDSKGAICLVEAIYHATQWNSDDTLERQRLHNLARNGFAVFINRIDSVVKWNDEEIENFGQVKAAIKQYLDGFERWQPT